MEQHGNTTTYNLENVLRQNIVNSDYYQKTCEQQLLTWDHVVDEIYEHVDHVEPWMSGNARGPSTAFCLMYRLFTMKLNVKQIKDLLDHRDSPYIRAIGFLYLRYVADPKSLWPWFQKYVNDREEFQPSGPHGITITMGDYVRDLLLEQNYFETLFLIRIPKKVADEITDELKKRGLPTVAKGNGGQGGADRRGTDDGNRRPASVKASLSVAMGQRAPNRSGAREEGRGKDPSMGRGGGGGRGRDGGRDGGRDATALPRSRSRSPAVQRAAEGDRERDRGGKDRDYGRERGKDWGGQRERDGGRGGGRDGRDRDADRRDDKYRGDERRRDDRDDRGRDSRPREERSQGRDERPRDRSREDRDRDRSRQQRSRSRSPRRGGAGAGANGRGSGDVFRERAAGVSDDIKSRYGDASGSKLFDDRPARKDSLRAEEVYHLGGSRR